MEEYKSNSYKSKNKLAANTTEKKELKKVVSGVAKTKKKSTLTKFTEVFIPEDVDNVKDYILFDVMIPAAKKLISDSIDALLYGGNSRRSKGGIAGRISYIDYNKASTRDRDRDRYYRDDNRRGTHSSTDIVLESRGDAEAVIMAMDELIEAYGIVSIADFNELVGVSGQYTDNNYGWSDIRSAKVVPVRDGYIIKMPKAMLID